MAQNTLILLFLAQNPNGNHNFKNSFRICQSQFEKCSSSLFQIVTVVWGFCFFNSRITEEIGQSFAIVVNGIFGGH